MADIADAAGFGSVRRFNEIFLNLFHRPPSTLRKRSITKEQEKDVGLRLRYRPPYDCTNMLAFFKARAPGVELVQDNCYSRTLEIDGGLGSIAVTHLSERPRLEVTILFSDIRALATIVARVRRLFDLGVDIERIEQHLSRDSALARLVTQRPGLRAPGGWDGFEVAIRAVLRQQISVPAARQLAKRLVQLHGRCVPKVFRVHPSLSHVFSDAKRLVSAASIALGMPKARLMALRAVAEASTANANLFHPFGRVEETVARLKTIRGIGEWTANYIALRALRESDAFPAADVGLLRGAASIHGTKVDPAGLLMRAESWRPWRAYAAQHLWAASGSPGNSMDFVGLENNRI